MKAAAREQRRTEIMDVAVRLLAEKGYRDTSMLDVAKSAGASKETLYHWFGDKRGLYEAIIRRNAETVQVVLEQSLDKAESTERTLRNFGAALLRLLTGDDAVAINRAAVSEARADPQLAMTLAAAGRDATLPPFVAFLEQRREAEGWDLDDPKAAAEAFLGLLIGDLQIRRLLGTAPKPSRKTIAARVARAARLFHRLHKI